jgi:cytochrome oxidase Cu insertion factor (SCO1/SenC/PrrC family)
MARKNSREFQFKTLLKGATEKDVNGNLICYPDIVETTNYELLKLLKCNRDVAPAHVQKMGASVTQLGSVLRDVVVVKIGFDYFIADGQHLTAYLKQSNLPIRCKMVTAKDERDALKVVTMLNSTSRNWGIKNFVEGWSNFNKDVKVLKDLKKKFGLTYTTIGALLTNSTSTLAKRQIASGDFKVVDMEEAVSRITAIDHFYNATGFVRSQYATTGLIDFMGNLGIEKYSRNQSKFIQCIKKGMKKRNFDGKTYGRKEDYLAFFNECWNA